MPYFFQGADQTAPHIVPIGLMMKPAALVYEGLDGTIINPTGHCNLWGFTYDMPPEKKYGIPGLANRNVILTNAISPAAQTITKNSPSVEITISNNARKLKITQAEHPDS